jgi:hypothetical protein
MNFYRINRKKRGKDSLSLVFRGEDRVRGA